MRCSCGRHALDQPDGGIFSAIEIEHPYHVASETHDARRCTLERHPGELFAAILEGVHPSALAMPPTKRFTHRQQ